VLHGPLEHRGSLHLRFEEGDDRPHPLAEDGPDLPHVLVRHLNAVQDELRRVLRYLILLNQAVDDDPADGNADLVKPIDGPGDHGDGEALRQGDEEEGGESIVGQQGLRLLPLSLFRNNAPAFPRLLTEVPEARFS